MKKKPFQSLLGAVWLIFKRLPLKLSMMFLVLLPLSLSAQQVTIKMKNATFVEVAREIQRQTELTFLYNDTKVGKIVGLNPDFTNTDVKVVLAYCLKGTGLNFSIMDNTVVLTPVRESDSNNQKKLRVEGQVMDVKGLPLPGVNILIKGTTVGFVSDIDGKFTAVCNPGDSLFFSMVGLESVTLGVKDETFLKVVMKESVESLDEVVVVSTGYSRIPKERATGSFGVVTAKDLERMPTANVMNRLEGVVPGVYVDIKNSDNTFLYGGTRNDGYQEEQNNIAMTIRGKSTYQGITRPLLVVDGFPTELEMKNLNPSDIASITFLKDAAAASIWGARAANGVIVVETKKGQKGQAGPAINFSMNITTSGAPRFNTLPVMNSAEMIDYEREMVDKGYIVEPTNTQWSASGPITQAAKVLLAMKNGTMTQDDGEAVLEELASREAYRDVKKYLLQSSSSQSYNLSFSGSGDQMSYFLSASYAKEKSSMVGQQGDRFTLTSNLDFKIKNWATLTTGLKLAYINLDNNALGLSPIQTGTLTTPLMPYDYLVDDEGNRIDYYKTYNEDFVTEKENLGYKNWKYNYLDELDYMDDTRKESAVALNVGLAIPVPFVDGLVFNGQFMLEQTNDKERTYNNEDSFVARDLYNNATTYDAATGKLTHNLPDGGLLYLAYTNSRNFSWRWQLDYDATIAERHQIAALAGMELRETRQWNSSTYYYGYNDQTLISGTQLPNPYTNIFGWSSYLYDNSPEKDYQRRYLSYYGNVSYTLLSKYVLTGSVRYDDYNNFGVDRKYRATPMWSAGLAWHATREKFVQENVGWLNSLTLRATYGYNGNIKQDEYPFTNISSSSSTDGYTQRPSSSITFAANPAVRWEKVGVLNLGLDFSVLDRRLSGNFELYRKYARDMFASFYINPIFGANASSSYALNRNGAKMNVKGFDAALDAAVVRNENVNYKIRLTYSSSKSEVISSPYEMSSYFYSSGGGAGGMLEGYSMDNFWAYRWAGLDENGDSQVYNADGNVVSSTENVTNDDLVYVGNTTPKYYGGMFHTLSYKGLSLYVAVTYKLGYIFQKPTLSQQAGGRNAGYEINEDMAKRWREAGDEATTDVPRIGTSSNSFVRYMGADIHIQKGDHIRLREISLSYNLPSRWLDKIMVKGASCAFSVTNVGLIWKKNKVGIDPDFIPNSRSLKMASTPTYNFSLNFNF